MVQQHISKQNMESLALGRLPTQASISVQRHLYQCGKCLQRLVEITFGLALDRVTPEALPVVSKRKALFIVHDTADGFIYSRTERRGRKWIARHWGEQLEGGKECKTLGEANEFLVSAFSQMFPEHRCTERCATQAL